MPIYKIPDLNEERRLADQRIKPWSGQTLENLEESDAGHQMDAARDTEIPEIKESDTVFVFAGSTGMAAGQLEYRYMLFTDASLGRVKYAKAHFPLEKRRKTDFKEMDVFNELPKRKFDWVFSFDPFFVDTLRVMPARLVSIAKKGVVIASVFDDFGCLKRSLEVYGVELGGVTPRGYGSKPGYILALVSQEVRERAQTDLNVLKTLNSLRRRDRGSLEKARERLRLTEQEFRKSLERWTKLCTAKDRVVIKVKY